MSKLSGIFQAALSPTSPAGHAVNREELKDAIRRSSIAEIKLFADRALDSIADGELVQLISEKIGPTNIPQPTNTLTLDAASNAWLSGAVVLKKGDTDPQKVQAAKIMQRALVKLAVHHPQGKEISALLQLPWAADGAIGEKTIAALNKAMEIAGKPELKLSSANAPIGKAVAEALEGLLDQTIPLIHPTTLNAPPPPAAKNVVLFVGMGDYAAHEAAWVKKALPAGLELRFVGDSSLGDDKIKVRVGSVQTVFDLKLPADRKRFVDTAFKPPLTEDQKTLVKEALEARAWGMADARDEIATMALELHQSQVTHGRAIPIAFFSGHSAGHGIWGDHNGELPMESVRKVLEAFPEATGGDDAPMFMACNHLHPSNVEELKEIFPGMKYACGYSAYAPGTWVGGLAQAMAWASLVCEGYEVITPEMMRAKCQELRNSAAGNNKNPLYYAMEKSYHIATWNRSDGLYRKFKENENGSWSAVVREMGPDPAEIASRWSAVQALNSGFRDMLQGKAGAPDLRSMVPHGDNLACEFYEAAVALAGTMGLSAEQASFAKECKELGLRARYYGRILEKFCEELGPVIDSGNQELSSHGFTAFSKAKLSSASTSRAAMLAYIAAVKSKVQEIQSSGGTCSHAAQLSSELDMRIARFENIPSSWL